MAKAQIQAQTKSATEQNFTKKRGRQPSPVWAKVYSLEVGKSTKLVAATFDIKYAQTYVKGLGNRHGKVFSVKADKAGNIVVTRSA